MRLIFSTSGEESVEHELMGFAARAEDARPVLTVIARAIREHERELFDTEGHGEWPALAEATVERKAAEGLNPKILQATEEMHDALAEQGGNRIEHVTDDELIIAPTGAAAQKAAWHKAGAGHLPVRDPIMFGDDERRGVTKAVQRYLIETERGAGIGTGPFSTATLDPFGL